MTHRSRILKALAQLPPQRGMAPGLPRTVLEGLARTARDRAAASALIDYMLALGELVMFGGRRGATYGLPRKR